MDRQDKKRRVTDPGTGGGGGEAEPRPGLAKILVVEDEADAARALESLLAHEGYRVRTASRGEEALAIASRFAPDLLLTDLVLGGRRDGVDLAIVLRARFPRLAVVLMSGLPRDEVAKRARQGAIAHISRKPLRMVEVKRSIREALAR